MSRSRDFSTRPGVRIGLSLDIIFTVIGALFLGWSTYSAWSARTDLSRVRQALDEARRQKDEDLSRLRSLESRKGPTGEAIMWAALLTMQAPPARVLTDLAGVMPGEARLDGLSMTYGEQIALDVQVSARNAPAYDRFVSGLTSSPLFSDLVPGPENREGEIQATLRMTYRPSELR